MSAMSSPDCRDRNHAKCNGDAWDLDLDRPAHCPCPCHVDAAHGARIDYHADSGRHIVVHPDAIPTVTRVLRREGILPGIPTEVPPVDPDKVKGIPAPRTMPVKVNGKVVGYAKDGDIVITDEPTMARLLDLGRMHVTIGPLDGPPIVSHLLVRPNRDRS